MAQRLQIALGADSWLDCEAVLLVPEIAEKEAGYIQAFHQRQSGHLKHDYHALAQMAYYQYQDEEVQVEALPGPLQIVLEAEQHQAETGLLLVRTVAGDLRIFAAGQVSVKKLLEAVHRYCTRWVRLDI